MSYGAALHSEAGGRMKAQVFTVVVCCLGVAACSVQRAMVAQDAQGKIGGPEQRAGARLHGAARDANGRRGHRGLELQFR